jgi:hypothetical protein
MFAWKLFSAKLNLQHHTSVASVIFSIFLLILTRPYVSKVKELKNCQTRTKCHSFVAEHLQTDQSRRIHRIQLSFLQAL